MNHQMLIRTDTTSTSRLPALQSSQKLLESVEEGKVEEYKERPKAGVYKVISYQTYKFTHVPESLCLSRLRSPLSSCLIVK